MGNQSASPADKWEQRFKSNDELAAYKAGIQVGRESKSKGTTKG
jgi:hypothetical protein